jgi:hypothetical protein
MMKRNPIIRFIHIAIGFSLFIAGAQNPVFAKPWKDFKGEMRDTAIPKDVRRYVMDGQACWHFLGEEPYDKSRKAFLDKKMKQHCTPRLDVRGKKLQKKYKDNAAALTAINEIMIEFREPNLP